MSQTVTWTTSQWGASAGGGWVTIAPGDTAASDLSLLPGVFTGGVIFNAAASQTLRFNASSFILDPPVVVVSSLSFYAHRGTGPTATLRVGLVPDPTPDDFSASFLPWGRGELELGDFILTGIPFSPTNLLFTLSMGSDAQTLIRAHVTSKNSWNGKVALSLKSLDVAVDIKNGPSFPVHLNTSQDLFFSGLAGGPYGGHVRAVRDSRFGMAAFHTELVPDGDQPSLYVRPFDVDPEDEEAKYRPRPGEGTRDDKVPDL